MCLRSPPPTKKDIENIVAFEWMFVAQCIVCSVVWRGVCVQSLTQDSVCAHNLQQIYSSLQWKKIKEKKNRNDDDDDRVR